MDGDLIFELEPKTPLALALCYHDRNNHLLVDRLASQPPDRETRESSASTFNGDDEADLLSHPGVRLRFQFQALPRDPQSGYLFGRSDDCDVFLASRHGNREYVSRRHFSIAFDPTGRLVVRSFNTAPSMTVSYDG